MLSVRRITSGQTGAAGGRYLPAWGRVLYVDWTGGLNTLDPVSGAGVRLGVGYQHPADLVGSPDGATLYVSETSGTVLAVRAEHPDRADARELARGLVSPHQLAVAPDGSVLVVEFEPGAGRLLRIPAGGGTPAVLATGLNRAAGLALDPAGNTAYVTEHGTGQVPGDGRLLAIDLGGGVGGGVRVVLDGLVAPFFVGWADAAAGRLLVTERDPVNRVGVVEVHAERPVLRPLALTGSRPSCPTTLPAGGAYRPGEVAAPDVPEEIVLLCEEEILAVDVSAGVLPTLDLEAPEQPLFVGGWTRLRYRLGGGLTPDEVEFDVPEGAQAGAVSCSREAGFDFDTPDLILLGGSLPGTYTLRARETRTGAELARCRFEVTAEWEFEEAGPTVAFSGPSHAWVTGGAGVTGGTWYTGGPWAARRPSRHDDAWISDEVFGGPAPAGAIPASGVRRVAIVLVDTATGRYPQTGPTVAETRAQWSNELLGSEPDADGVFRSVHHYYQEVSDGRFDVTLAAGAVLGPVRLPGQWTDYFDWNADREVWWARGHTLQAVVTAAQELVDFDGVDSLVAVVNSLPAPPVPSATGFAWPSAAGGNFSYRRPGLTGLSQRSFATLVMPVDWEMVDGRRIHETLSHEIGHNLGLGDLRSTVVGGPPQYASATELPSADLMSWNEPLPHLSIAHKMMLGWVDPALIRSYDLAAGGGVDETITLQATETLSAGLSAGPAAGGEGGELPDGRVAGVQLHRADGWNSYLEYRAGGPADGPGGPGPGSVVASGPPALLGTDVLTGPSEAPRAQQSVVMLDDPDLERPVLLSGGSEPAAPASFAVDVLATTPDSAEVRVRYGAGGFPDPSIRPWPGGDDFSSPDIEIRNARSDADGSWINALWAGHENRLIARVRNSGDFVATGVRVNFAVKDFAVGDAPETTVGSDVQDIPPGAVADFQTSWTPPANTPDGQACYGVVVRIPHYRDPSDPSIVELTEANNAAQSGYARIVSATGPRSRRGVCHVVVHNPYPQRTRAWLVGQQTMPFYRAYLRHQWVWLDPGETRRIEVMVESLAGDPAFAQALRGLQDRFHKKANRLSLIGMLENPVERNLHVAAPSGGVNIIVSSGEATRIEHFDLHAGTVRGQVRTITGEPVSGGNVIVTIQPGGAARQELHRIARLRADGDFSVDLPLGDLIDGGELAAARAYRLQAHYPGGTGLADCDSEARWLEA